MSFNHCFGYAEGKLYRSNPVGAKEFKALGNKDRLKIVEYLNGEGKDYASSIAENLEIEEQRCRYHISVLKSAGLIEEAGQRSVNGSEINDLRTAKSFHYIADPKTEEVPLSFERNPYRKLFGNANKVEIVGGSPYPHGEHDVGSRDGHLVGILTKKLCREVPEMEINVRLDTDAENSGCKLVLGGPLTNTESKSIMDSVEPSFTSKGSLSYFLVDDSTYREDNVGIVVILHDPVRVLLAGIGLPGTEACIEFFCSGNNHEFLSDQASNAAGYFILRGLDSDSDGEVDDFEVVKSQID